MAAAAFTALTPMLGGCVSAVDESSAFGFSPSQSPATQVAEAASVTEETPVENEVASGAASDAVAAQTAGDAPPPAVAEAVSAETLQTVASAAKPAEATAPGEGSIGTAALMRPTSAPAIAAFAAPGNREADRSLYASLYNESRARTPLKNAETGKSRRVVVLQREGAPDDTGDALPGVDPKSLFEIGQRASVDSELMDDIGGEYQIASLSGIARLAPSGLLVQRQDIQTNCFGRDLMGLISQIETRFRQKVVITSGMRTPQHNRRVNGAKASLHMACKAADLHVPGVNGQEVAKFVRALPNRGGVGTYCHTAAIHIDTGAQRDWNWPCRTRRAG